MYSYGLLASEYQIISFMSIYSVPGSYVNIRFHFPAPLNTRINVKLVGFMWTQTGEYICIFMPNSSPIHTTEATSLVQPENLRNILILYF